MHQRRGPRRVVCSSLFGDAWFTLSSVIRCLLYDICDRRMSLSTIQLSLHISLKIMTSEPTATTPLPEPMDNYPCMHRSYRTIFILHPRRLNIHFVGPKKCELLATRRTPHARQIPQSFRRTLQHCREGRSRMIYSSRYVAYHHHPVITGKKCASLALPINRYFYLLILDNHLFPLVYF